MLFLRYVLVSISSCLCYFSTNAYHKPISSPYHNGVAVSMKLFEPSSNFVFRQTKSVISKLPKPFWKLFPERFGQFGDNGFSLSNNDIARWFKRILRPLRPKPGNLILVQHGETLWHVNQTFTGWVDVDLSDHGCREVEHAGRLLLAEGYSIDVVYTSTLKRAIRSTWILLTELNQLFRPVYKSWRLNERMYGALEGLSKPEMAQTYGEDHVQAYRTGFDVKPPPMTYDHPHWHKTERKYSALEPHEIPLSESLHDSIERAMPLWFSRILPEIQSGRNVMVVAHSSALHGIVKYIDNIPNDAIRKVGIPNAIPLVYKFDRNMKPIPQEMAVAPLSGRFLEKKGQLKAALEKEAELSTHVPGYSMATTPAPIDPKIRSLSRLSMSQQLFSLASGEPLQPPKLTQFSTLGVTPHSVDASSVGPHKVAGSEGINLKKPVVVIIRHGKTEYNKLGLFTGWEDAPLAEEGREEARAAGRLMRAHGIEFDVVYTSWLSRAIETAWTVLLELDSVWLPIFKSWRLNERMYGSLTGMSKKMIQQKHGDKQYKLWRRSYKTRPPVVSSFSNHYPGNDDRYPKYVKDVRFSLFESLIRSIAHGKLELHRKFPKTESLSDCTKRTIPYFKEVIVPGSIAQNKSVLIASSENAIRGLLMHLCEIPADRIHELEIPTGVPLVYDVEKKRIRLLDDGLSPDPLERYNFGEAVNYLFRPCDESSSNRENDCFAGPGGSSLAYDPIVRLPVKPSPIVPITRRNVSSSILDFA